MIEVRRRPGLEVREVEERDLFVVRRTVAVFSEDLLHRLRYRRTWGEGPRGLLGFLMLNPSRAGKTRAELEAEGVEQGLPEEGKLASDATVTRCARRAELLGYRGIEVVNLFTRLATDPDDLAKLPIDDLNAPEAERAIRETYAAVDRLVLAWGAEPIARTTGRASEVLERLLELDGGRDLFTLGTTKDGIPCHPLYIPYERKLAPWRTST
jgi:hypothetical protein